MTDPRPGAGHTPARAPAAATDPDGTVRLATVGAAIAAMMLAACVLINGYPTPLQVDGIDESAIPLWTAIAVVLAGAILAVPWWRWRNEVYLIVPGVLLPFAVAQGWATGYFRSPLGVGVQVAEFFVIATLVGLTQRRGVVLAFSLSMLAAASMLPTIWILRVRFIITAQPRTRPGEAAESGASLSRL